MCYPKDNEEHHDHKLYRLGFSEVKNAFFLLISKIKRAHLLPSHL